MFIDRDDEIKALEERSGSGKAEFIVMYGRRRVGKTEIIDYFVKGKKGIRLLGRTESEKDNLTRFSRELAEFFSDGTLKLNPFQNWDAFFAYIAEKTRNAGAIIAIDEFPYLIDANKAIPSILQDHWDRNMKNSKICLILCGSSIAMMVTKVLGHKSPLYGRRTGQMKIEPMGFFSSCKFFPKFSLKDKVYAYSILGGTPGYLLEFDDKKSISENISEKFLKEARFLFQDAEFVLREELKEPKFYFSILRAIAIGKTKLGEIVNETGLGKGIVGKYISVLIDLDMVKRDVSVTEKQAHKSRKGIYVLKDNFYRFWFNFIFPNIEEIEQKKQETLISRKIMPHIDHYASYAFEGICREWLWRMKLFDYERVGRWWEKEEEIDITAINSTTREILFAECKWQDDVDAEKIISELKDKSKLVNWNQNARKEYFAVFARSFGRKVKQSNVFLFELKDMKN
ncbi:MAG: ATP-binding protein [Nanoarchaeota archaeon]|nr:ATP-binding protein [Nanoarchaeota archaeon]